MSANHSSSTQRRKQRSVADIGDPLRLLPNLQSQNKVSVSSEFHPSSRQNRKIKDEAKVSNHQIRKDTFDKAIENSTLSNKYFHPKSLNSHPFATDHHSSANSMHPFQQMPSQGRKERKVSSIFDPSQLSRKPSFHPESSSSDASLSRKTPYRNSPYQSSKPRPAPVNGTLSPHYGNKKPPPNSSDSDDGALKRFYSHRVPPSSSKSLLRQKCLPEINVDSRKVESDGNDETANLHKIPSMKSGRRRLSPEEREERRRVRNRENSRRIREKQRQEQKAIERIYDVNEARIKKLEQVVDELSSELGRRNTISNVGEGLGITSSVRGRGPDVKMTDERPAWFGECF